jgi:hypothetical protein
MEEKQYQFLKYYFDLIKKPVFKNWKEIFKFPEGIDPSELVLVFPEGIDPSELMSVIPEEIEYATISTLNDELTMACVLFIKALNQNIDNGYFGSIYAIIKKDKHALRVWGDESGCCFELDKYYGVSYLLMHLDTNLPYAELKTAIKDIKNYEVDDMYSAVAFIK